MKGTRRDEDVKHRSGRGDERDEALALVGTKGRGDEGTTRTGTRRDDDAHASPDECGSLDYGVSRCGWLLCDGGRDRRDSN